METTVSFMNVSEFKKAIDASELKVVFNKKSNKLSVLADGTNFYRCQQAIDTNQRMAFLIPDGELDNACLVNVKGEGSPLETKITL